MADEINPLYISSRGDAKKPLQAELYERQAQAGKEAVEEAYNPVEDIPGGWLRRLLKLGGVGIMAGVAKPDLSKRLERVFSQRIAKRQRGVPEQAMLKVQTVAGGGVLNPVVEHTGDLIHRMTERPTFESGGYDYVRNKTDKILRVLTQPYGFVREHEQNMFNNATYRGVDPSAHKQAVAAALADYAAAHKKIPTYNMVQQLAKDAAVSVGEQRFDSTISYLQQLKTILDQGIGRWVEEAHRWGK